MKIEGAIDTIAVVPDGRICISGWASSGAAEDRAPVDTILLRGVTTAELSFFSRPDFAQGDNAFGFRLVLQSRADLLKLYREDGAVFAVKSGLRCRLLFWSALDEQIARLLAGDIQSTREPPPEPTRERPPFVLTPGETVTHRIEVGLINPDRAVIVGRGGHLFLIGGSNEVEQLYAPGAPIEAIDAWLDLIRSRARRLAGLGIQFVQIIVPEKQSVLAHAFPADIATPSPLLAGIVAGLKDEPYFLDSLAWLAETLEQDGLDPFRKIDTHLTFAGARALARAIVNQISGFLPDREHPPLAVTHRPGDLGSKFGAGRLMEELLWPVVEDWPFACLPVEPGRAIDPPNDGHIGCLREWTCAKPLIDKTLLIFGNSFFGRDVDPSALSWWAARLFRRTIFYWSPAVDWAVVEAEKPDIVICQSIERFLREVPET